MVTLVSDYNYEDYRLIREFCFDGRFLIEKIEKVRLTGMGTQPEPRGFLNRFSAY